MKSLRYIAAVAALAAVAAATPAPARAQMSEFDKYRARWAFYNLDEREVNRFKKLGYNDDDLKKYGNIALRSGLDMDYVIQLNRNTRMMPDAIAHMYGIPPWDLNDDIPGYGMKTASAMWDGTSSSGGAMMGAPAGSGTPSTPSTPTTPTTPPPSASTNTRGTVVDVAMGNSDFSTLVAALKAADLVGSLQAPGPFTVLAPTNAAFAKLPSGTLEDLLKPENKEKLREILTYHVISGKVKSGDVMAMSNPQMPRTLSGKTVTVKTTAPVTVNNARVTATDIEATNGVIHVLDTVLMPPAS